MVEFMKLNEMEKEQIFILPDSQINCCYTYNPEDVAIVINLYYLEMIEFYAEYLNAIPEKIVVFIFSSNRQLLEEAKKIVIRKHVLFKLKENRGRDISALLVAFYPFFSQYKYLCFLHDKSAKRDFEKKDLDFWVKNLWENMIKSQGYISNVIELLQLKGYGMLLPPKPVGEYMDAFYIDPWHNDFDNVCYLAKHLGLKIKIEKKDTEKVSLGSAFWCCTNAIERLFSCNWKYTDFSEEPMPDDGTISHAIERIFGFMAFDSGYKVGYIMTLDYASQLISLLQQKLKFTYEWLWKNIGIKNTYQLSCVDEEKEQILKMFEIYKKVFLYGAGIYGEKYLQRLLFWGCYPTGFLVSDGKRKESMFCGYKVYELKEVREQVDYGIIITVNPNLQQVIEKNLEFYGIYNYYKAAMV